MARQFDKDKFLALTQQFRDALFEITTLTKTDVAIGAGYSSMEPAAEKFANFYFKSPEGLQKFEELVFGDETETPTEYKQSFFGALSHALRMRGVAYSESQPDQIAEVKPPRESGVEEKKIADANLKMQYIETMRTLMVMAEKSRCRNPNPIGTALTSLIELTGLIHRELGVEVSPDDITKIEDYGDMSYYSRFTIVQPALKNFVSGPHYFPPLN